MKYYLAIDIGASGGRHIVGYEKDGEILTQEIYRFCNGMDKIGERTVWNTDRLFTEVKEGIRLALLSYPRIESMSIDTWGADYVLLKGESEVEPTYAYRDSRTDESIDKVHGLIPFEELYRRTGIQFNSFNTIYQLYCDKLWGRLEGLTDFLMIPEYLMYKLTGVKKKEYTNASTTGLVNAATKEYDREIFKTLGISEELMSPLSMPGETLGGFLPEVQEEVGGNIKVVLTATHDTASAVEAVRMSEDAPYISSGTWSLLGIKADAPLTDEKSRLAGYTNEGGVGYIRYLKNITGMWLIQSLRRENCPELDWDGIVDLAKKSSFEGTFDVNAREFLAPDNMATAIREYFRARGEREPESVGDLFNSAYHSLARSYKEAIEQLEFSTGRIYTSLYIVGGGAKNEYLNSLAGRYTGKRIVAQPIEATAIGNIMVQMKYDN